MHRDAVKTTETMMIIENYTAKKQNCAHLGTRLSLICIIDSDVTEKNGYNGNGTAADRIDMILR